MRSLTIGEIATLEHNSCWAEDWERVSVSDSFTPEHIYDVHFYGDVLMGVYDKMIEVEQGFLKQSGIRHATLKDVEIGDNCIIENIGNHISHYVIGDECYISNVGTISTTEDATFGQPNKIAVLNEACNGNVVIYDGLTSQIAALMIMFSGDDAIWNILCNMAIQHANERQLNSDMPTGYGLIDYGVKIINTNEIINTNVSAYCEICGASRVSESTLHSSVNASIFLGSNVICDNSVVCAGASIVDYAKLNNCYIGEACHIGKGFSAESSLFFANSYMDNGEACASFCGPFSVSHHKATLLIGGLFSFYNAGSSTNFSNHAYKTGPIHFGCLLRGSKTASGCHILWPASIGVFSTCIGKIQDHPDTTLLPFSYVIGNKNETYIVPGRNLISAGTYRDINKWPKRDKRPYSGRQSIVNEDWLNPFVILSIFRGKTLLEGMLQGHSGEEYLFGSCIIRRSSLVKGIHYYDLALRLFMGEAFKDGADIVLNPCNIGDTTTSENCCCTGSEDWHDLSGLLIPASLIEKLKEDIQDSYVGSIYEIEEFLNAHANAYEKYKRNAALAMIRKYYSIDKVTGIDADRIIEDGKQARHEWLTLINEDAEKEKATLIDKVTF